MLRAQNSIIHHPTPPRQSIRDLSPAASAPRGFFAAAPASPKAVSPCRGGLFLAAPFFFVLRCRPGAGLFLILSPCRGAATSFFSGPDRKPVFPCGGHTFSPAAERKYQRDAAREGLFTEMPLSGLSLLRGKSQLRDDVLSLYSLLSFCCRSAVAEGTCTRLRCLADPLRRARDRGTGDGEWGVVLQAPFPRSPVLPRGSKGPRRVPWPRERNS